MSRPLLLVLATCFATAILAGDARAACFAPGARTPLPTGKAQFAATAAAAAAAAADDDSNPAASVAGLWNTIYFIGNGHDVYDQAYQQFHADGNENMLSRGLPPVLGNVCLGVWKRVGPRTFKVRHVAWNWNLDGTFAGTFEMEVTLRVNRKATSYTGAWVADNFNVSGAAIPDLHFEGIAQATRITVD
jgi:hypothetical protein